MEVTGKIILDLGEINGTSKAGNSWRKKEFVLETEDTYPKKIHFDLFGDRVDQYPLQVGQRVRLSFDIESREYQGRWYTSIRGWRAEPADAVSAQPQAAPANPAAGMASPFPSAPIPPTPASNDNLPF